MDTPSGPRFGQALHKDDDPKDPIWDGFDSIFSDVGSLFGEEIEDFDYLDDDDDDGEYDELEEE